MEEETDAYDKEKEGLDDGPQIAKVQIDERNSFGNILPITPHQSCRCSAHYDSLVFTLIFPQLSNKSLLFSLGDRSNYHLLQVQNPHELASFQLDVLLDYMALTYFGSLKSFSLKINQRTRSMQISRITLQPF